MVGYVAYSLVLSDCLKDSETKIENQWIIFQTYHYKTDQICDPRCDHECDNTKEGEIYVNIWDDPPDRTKPPYTTFDLEFSQGYTCWDEWSKEKGIDTLNLPLGRYIPEYLHRG